MTARHAWEESFRDPHRTVRQCKRCGLLKISRHESEGARAAHWTELWRGSERLTDGPMPACQPVVLPDDGEPCRLQPEEVEA